MIKNSAGILCYRKAGSAVEVLLVHPGGPFWKNKDDGVWSLPKGEFPAAEVPLQAAKREFLEETGFRVKGKCLPLGSVRMTSGKIIYAWAVEQNLDPDAVQSNMFDMEWPPKSGKKQSFPEIDRAGWFSMAAAALKLVPVQVAFLAALEATLAGG